MKKKTYIITEVITQTIATEYEVQATSQKEALELFRSEGQYLGDYSSSGKDRVEVTVKRDTEFKK